ncbi:MAG TPA: PAS domain-containing protein, partial [Aggregicoccus sp.]|nr:PAS domain-containing protein [Aggregicoccus sp.]
MPLADLLEAQQAALTDRWLEEVRPLAPRPDLTRAQLVDSLPAFFEELVRALRHLGGRGLPAALPHSSPVAEAHGSQRQALGYAADAVAREYPLLQELILRVAQESGVRVRASESILLARCMGTATAEALLHFGTASERELREDSVSAQARQALAEHELTRVQEAEARARQSESQLRLVLDTIPHAINFVDAQERYVLNNDTYRSWFGLQPEQIRGRTVREVVGEENYRALEPFIDRALAGEEGDYERPFVFQGGRRGYVHGHFVPHRAPDGRVLGYVALVQDITERYQLIAQL